MRTIGALAIAGLTLAIVASTVAAGALVGPSLQKMMATSDRTELIPVDVVLKKQADPARLASAVANMDPTPKRVTVASKLKEFSREEESGLVAYLELAGDRGLAENIEPLWIVNAIYAELAPEVIKNLLLMDDVWYVDYDIMKSDPMPTMRSNLAAPNPDTAWGVLKINAPAAWLDGYTGDGVVIGLIDTGVNWHHSDLVDHLWTDANYPNHGWDFRDNDNDPVDTDGHGTHCAGTIAGDGTAGCQTGVAPDAQILALRVSTQIDTVAMHQVWAAMQFAVSPPLSPGHGANAISMSLGWIYDWTPPRDLWRTNCTNVGIGGIPMIVAAGNERGSYPPPNDLRCPGDVPPPWRNPDQVTGGLSDVISIGATTITDAYASFSSQGPVAWNISPFFDYPYPPGLLKPDVSAPGDNIKSCSYMDNNGYLDGWSGTSMATPHTAGTVALMLQKNPVLSPAEIDEILETTALDLGAAGKDNDYGAGRINAYEAVSATWPPDRPNVRSKGIVYDDTTGGNGDGIFDPWETVDAFVTLDNNGGADAESVKVVLRTSDTYLVIEDSTASYPDIPMGQNKRNDADPFVFSAQPGTPEGHIASVIAHITVAGGFQWDRSVEVRIGVTPVLWADHNIGNIVFTVTCIGACGHTETQAAAVEGSGLVFPKAGGKNMLKIGSLWVGNSASYVMNRDYTNDNADWQTVTPGGWLRLGATLHSDQDGVARYDDAGAPTPKGLFVEQSSWAWGTNPYDDFVIMRYKLKNTGASSLIGLYAGQFMDFDIDVADADDDIGGRNVPENMIFMHDTSDAEFVGVKPLGDMPVKNLTFVDNVLYVDPWGHVPDSYKFQFLKGIMGIPGASAQKNWSVLASVGPFDLAPGDSTFVAFAVIGGADYTDLIENGGWADSIYRDVGISEEMVALSSVKEFSLLQNVPNPFASRTSVRFTTGRETSVSLKVFDISGRAVATLYNDGAARGTHLVEWSGTDDVGKTVPSGIYFYRLSSSGEELTRKMVLLR